MITPAEFKERWEAGISDPEEALQLYPLAALTKINVPDETKQFLIEVGLPGSDSLGSRFGLKDAYYDPETDDSLENFAAAWEKEERFKIYYPIGHDCNGNPICLEEPTGHVVIILHDYGYEVAFVNSSVAQLAECLLVDREYMSHAPEFGYDALLRGNVSAELKEWYTTQIHTIDPETAKNTYWDI